MLPTLPRGTHLSRPLDDEHFVPPLRLGVPTRAWLFHRGHVRQLRLGNSNHMSVHFGCLVGLPTLANLAIGVAGLGGVLALGTMDVSNFSRVVDLYRPRA